MVRCLGMRDEWVIVLDFLQHGRIGMTRSEPVAQAIGDKFFSLLEVVIREEAQVKPEERLYIGEGKRDKVKYVRGRVSMADLTVVARDDLPRIVEKIVDADQKRFVDFFNKSGPITTRLHQLELLPGIGKKHMWDVIEARKEKPFETFEEVSQRIKLLPDPKKAIIRRILDEMENKDRYKLFVSGMPQRPF